MSLFKKLALLSTISILPAVSMDAAAPKPTIAHIQALSAEELANGNFDLKLTPDDWNGIFPGATTSDDALNAKSKVRDAMRLRSEKTRVNPDDARRAVEAAAQHEAAARENIGQGLDLGIAAEDLTQDLSASIRSILGKMGQLQGLADQSRETVTQIRAQVEALQRLTAQSGDINQQKQALLDDLRARIQTISDDQARVNGELPKIEQLLAQLNQ